MQEPTADERAPGSTTPGPVGSGSAAPEVPDQPGVPEPSEVPERSEGAGSGLPPVRLIRSPERGRGRPVALDDAQQAVVAHRQGQGPVVVFGGPGTGKTTVLVEALATRVERDGVPADGLLLLAATRQAASGLRERLSVRLSRTVREPASRTLASYAFGVLRRRLVLDGDVPPRLISGPEQDRILAELLAGHESGIGRPPAWPASVGPEIRTLRGFRDELRDLLMRAVERGLAPADLTRLGQRHGRPEWVAAAAVFAEYLDVTALATPGAYDPAGIVDAAARVLATDPDLLDAERDRWAVVGVDDAQELTAAGQRLIDLLAGGGHALVLAGDPDVATLTFRGALPQTVAGAAERFRRADGGPARTVVLGTAHRYGPLLRAVADRVAARIGSAGTVAHRAGPGATHRSGAAHRADPVGPGDGPADPAGPGDGPGPATPGAPPERSGDGEDVAVHVLASTAQEGAFVATWLRRRHLEQGVPWSRMAVVVRSARATRSLRRALGSAGVPVTVPGVEIAVRDEPAVLPLRLALRCCLDPEQLTAETAVALLSGPFGGVDAVALRRLRQALRAQELAGDGDRTSDALLVEALADPGHLATLDPRVAARARHVAALLQAGRRAADAPGATAETVLWALWEAAGVAEAWQRRALAGGQSGARADRDLDAVVALFDAAARHTDRLPHAGPGDFLGYLEGQELPSDTLAARAPDGEAVTLLTAAGAAGREWDAVAVPGVQEGTWPDLRLRNSLLGGQALADLLDGRVGDGADIVGGPGGPGGSGRAAVSAQRRAVLDDELRLFHVAVSRARRALLVTAVRSEEELPSSFLDLVDPLPADADERPLSAVPRAMTLPSLIAELRGVAADTGEPSGRRHRAARHLAELARAGVPGADPGDWYGLAPLSSIEPLRAEDEPVRVSPSKVEQFTRCALRWLLETSGGSPGSSSSQLLGTLVHEIAERAPNGTRAELAALLADRIDRLGLGEGWVDDRERQRLRSMVDKFAEYVAESRTAGREVVAVERRVEVGVDRAILRGSVDRLERDAEGRLVVVDLKTGRSQPAKAEVARHAQLGSYQVAVAEGGLGPDGQDEPGGALLVQLGSDRKRVSVQHQLPPAEDPDDPDWARALVVAAAEGMAGADFPATGNSGCRTCPVRRSCPLQPEGRQVGE